MKRPRAPYAKRSVWNAVVILSAVLVIACVLGGLEIYHLHNQVNSLQTSVNNLSAEVAQLYQRLINLTRVK